MNYQIHLKTLSRVAALLAAALTLLGVCMWALPAKAANLTEAEITISTESVVSSQWDQMDLTCEWSVPDNSQPGDTFSIQLPSELRWFGATSFNLDNPDGETVATAVANDAGLVVFTLTDFVVSHPLNVGGTCSFSTQYSLEPGPGETKELTFTVGSSVVRVPVVIEPCTGDCGPGVPTSAGKSMRWIDSSQTELESIFSMPPMASETNDVVVTDTPAPGLEMDCNRVTPRVGKNVSSTGNVVEPYDNNLYPATIDCTPQELTVSWTGLPEGEHVELFVATKVTDPSLDVYENSGTVTIAGKESPVVAQLRRNDAGGTGDGTTMPAPTPTPTTATPTPTPTPSTATPTTASPTPTSPGNVVPTEIPSEPTQADTSEQLANTGARGSAFIFVAAAFLALGSLLAFVGARWVRRRP